MKYCALSRERAQKNFRAWYARYEGEAAGGGIPSRSTEWKAVSLLTRTELFFFFFFFFFFLIRVRDMSL